LINVYPQVCRYNIENKIIMLRNLGSKKKSLVFNLVENDKPFKKEFIKSTQQ